MSKKKPASRRKYDPDKFLRDQAKETGPAVEAAADRELQFRAGADSSGRHPVSYKIGDSDFGRVRRELAEVCEAAGMEVKMAAYAKNALINHGRLRSLESKAQELANEVRGRIAELRAMRNRGAATELEDIASRLDAMLLKGGG
jgi:hypothetical protein